MTRRLSSQRAFTLVEVMIAIGVISFAFVGLLGVFPLALEQTQLCINETRSAQLARMVFATLASEPFTAAECFGSSGGGTVDFSAQNASSDPIILYAGFDVRDEAKIVRTATPPATAEYRLELRFEPATSGASSSRGALVRLRIMRESARNTVVFEGTQFLGKSARTVFAK